MIELTQKSVEMIKPAIKNKANKFVGLVFRSIDGTTQVCKLSLGKTAQERNDAIKVLKGLIPKDCGKVFCTVV